MPQMKTKEENKAHQTKWNVICMQSYKTCSIYNA
jgi:hypothetical protein